MLIYSSSNAAIHQLDALQQGCSVSGALETLQSGTKPS